MVDENRISMPVCTALNLMDLLGWGKLGFLTLV
jgi:hypothetical protein